jgi:aminoglycoside/choline kinase family phosphotransferase
MEDLGNLQYLSVLKAGRGVDKLYGDALTTLANIQVRGLPASKQLPPYDRQPLERELNLMPEWFLIKHLGLELTPEERALLTVTFEFLINEALLQPQVFVHRDYHSRNLMVLPPAVEKGGGPGVIDFQDALRGPIGYDLVSLLKDCYISWSRERVERWVRGYRRVLGNLGANVGDSEYQFLRWFDLIGVQRHIKVLGIFCRLWYRDGKAGYLNDLPLTFEYVRDACRRYPELVEFERWLSWRVAPLLEAANAREVRRAAEQALRHGARTTAVRRKVRRAARKPRRVKTGTRGKRRAPVKARSRVPTKAASRPKSTRKIVKPRVNARAAAKSKSRARMKTRKPRKAARLKRPAKPAARRRVTRRRHK